MVQGNISGPGNISWTSTCLLTTGYSVVTEIVEVSPTSLQMQVS